MKKEKKVWAMCSVLLGMFTTGQAIAQKDTIKSYDLQEVVITATKFPKSRSETGKVLNVITQQQLAQSAGKDLSQLLNEQVGLVVGGANSNPGKDKSVFLRGAGSEYTLLLLDGVPVNDPSGVGGAFDLRLLPIDQIERVEILKGSQSTLYGTDAIAGVINIITKKGGTRPIGATGTLTGGSYRTGKAQVGLNGQVKKFDYNVGYTYFDTQGISEAKDSTGKGNFDKDGYRQHAFQANLGFQATSKLSLKPFLRASNFKGKYDGGGFADDATAEYTAKLLNTGLLAQYKLNRGAVNLQYAYDHTDRTFSTSAYQSAFKGRFNSAELFFNYNLTSNLQVLAGTNFQDLKMLDTTATTINPSVTITSPYVSFFLHNLKGFSMELGGRYNHHSRYGDNYTYSFNPSYLINRKVKLFFNYSTGFKAPTLYQLYGQYGHNENLKPERSQSTEGGIETFLADGKIDIRVVAFNRKIKNAIQYTYTPGYINLNTQNDHGLEIEPTIQVTKKISVRAYYAYVTGEITTKIGERDTTYFNLIRRPKHSFGINVSYQITPALFVSANLKTFSKRSDLFFNPTTYATERVSLAAYQLLTVYAEYQLIQEKLRFFVDVKNVLNQDYTEVYGYSTQGFNINLGISFKY